MNRAKNSSFEHPVLASCFPFLTGERKVLFAAADSSLEALFASHMDEVRTAFLDAGLELVFLPALFSEITPQMWDYLFPGVEQGEKAIRTVSSKIFSCLPSDARDAGMVFIREG